MAMRIDSEPSLDPGDYEFSHTVRVRFSETDAMGIVHHSRYLPTSRKPASNTSDTSATPTTRSATPASKWPSSKPSCNTANP